MQTNSFDNSIITAAQNGDAGALDDVVRHVQDRVYRLAVRMLADPEHAMDATQEILIRVVTKLSAFKGESMFETWVYRIATNYLLTAKKVLSKDQGLTFDIFGADLENGLVDETARSAEDHVMLNELRISCTMAMLLCLDPDHRIAYTLGEIFEFDQVEASEILGISKENFRKRLSRARKSVVQFTASACGLASPQAKCSCPRRLPQAIRMGRISFGSSPTHPEAPSYASVRAEAERTEAALVAAKLQRAIGPLRAPIDLAARIHDILTPSD